MKLCLLLLSVMALLMLAACQPPPELRDASLLQDTSLLTDEPCSAPCWRNITPGQTAWRDALTIIEDDPTLMDMQLQQDENSPAIVATFKQANGGDCCQMFTQDGETVDLLFLRVAPLVKLGDLIDAKGDPSYLIGSGFSDDQAIMNLLYPEQNLVVYVFVAGEQAGSLNDNSEAIGVLYMKQEEMSLLLQTSELQAWEGYQTYQFYAESTLEVTPSITLTPTATPGS